MTALERFLARNHPGPALARQRREDQVAWDAGMARMNHSLQRSPVSWLIATAELGRVEADPFYERTER